MRDDLSVAFNNGEVSKARVLDTGFEPTDTKKGSYFSLRSTVKESVLAGEEEVVCFFQDLSAEINAEGCSFERVSKRFLSNPKIMNRLLLGPFLKEGVEEGVSLDVMSTLHKAKKKMFTPMAATSAVVENNNRYNPVQTEHINRIEEKVNKTSTSVFESLSLDVVNLNNLIINTVDAVQIGKVDGVDLIGLDLSVDAMVPESFAGSRIEMSYEDGVLNVSFSNFTSLEQEKKAIDLVQTSEIQLKDLMNRLQERDIKLANMKIGLYNVALPVLASEKELLEETFRISNIAEQVDLKEKEDIFKDTYEEKNQ